MAHILMLSTMDGTPWGGSELLWADAASHLVRQGHQVSACTMLHPGVTVPALQKLQGEGVQLHHWRRLPKVFRLVRSPERLTTPNPQHFLAKLRPDLLLINNGYQVPPAVWTEAAYELGIPYAHLCHSFIESIWPDEAVISRGAKALERAAAAFWVSESNQRGAYRQFVAVAPVSEVVRNPYQVSRDIPFSWPGNEGLQLAFVGRLANAHKGCDLLLEVLQQQKWQGRNLHVSFFGTGPSEARLKLLAERWGLNNVSFRGHVSDVDGIWREHHALVLPSRQEGLPIVIVEAMMRGRPCIVTEVAGNAELLVRGETGFVADGPNVRALDRALEEAWAAREQLREIGERAYQQIRAAVPAEPGAVFAQRLLQLIGQ
ncbi:MAG: glycosyltransferase family 4 protein [Verrucomicrobiota bacterium JB022]|nr:glycosyltransferase family 4 protein [Verrucomicrobiota bacterium JB022]